MGCPGDHHAALQLLQDHGPLTVEQASNLLWKGMVADRLITASLLAHLIDQVTYDAITCTFSLTDQERPALVSGAAAAVDAL